MPTDRLVPDRVGEVYYLKYNPQHQWFVSPAPLNTLELLILILRRYWLSTQKSSEPYAFVMYDTKAGTHARCK